MSDTPWTDANACNVHDGEFDQQIIYESFGDFVPVEFARQLERELIAAQKDAERYRWLRQWAGRLRDMPDMPDTESPEEFDAAIDAAIAAEKPLPPA